MDGYQTNDDVSVTSPERFGPKVELAYHQRDRDTVAAEVLASHIGTRVRAALIIAAIQVVVLLGVTNAVNATTGISRVVMTVLMYVAVVIAIHAVSSRKGVASTNLVTLTLCADLALIFGLTATATTPEHYDRALFGTIVVVHVANYFFGRRQAWRVVQLGLAGYLLLIASASLQGARINVAEELWTAAACAAGIVLMVVQTVNVRRRLHTIVRLFEHVENGDFSREYDVAADGRSDAITRVGHAYNAVRAQLSSLVLTDSLTGCLNRRGFDQALVREVSRATRAGSEFALLSIDLDHFKLINDNFGHLAGDKVLRTVGSLLINSGRAGDVVARVGGEEFAILLADTGSAGAQLFASRLCERVRDHSFDIGTSLPQVPLTTSIGVAVGAPRGAKDFGETLRARADDALYESKRSGRDCVSIWSDKTRRSGDFAVINMRSPTRQIALHIDR
ncbi:MAG: putative rane protein [Gemmatimonadetes bacterium]|nr:putative rane protein [Gemmatimonadota bacterium]